MSAARSSVAALGGIAWVAGGKVDVMAKIDDWKNSLEHIADEISELWFDRHIWRSMTGIADKRPGVRDSFILAWIGEQYYRRAAVAVRTMVDRAPDSDSLLNLLTEIAENPTEIICPGALFTMRAPGLDTVDPAQVRADIDGLTQTAASTRQYVNKYLAHIDRAPTVQIPATNEVDDGVRLLGDLLKKYTLLLRDTDLKVEPLVLFDWTAALREAWLPPKS
jgi:hypothetical protein